MLRLLALAAHFSPFNPGPFDPEVVQLLNGYFEPQPSAHADPAIRPASDLAEAPRTHRSSGLGSHRPTDSSPKPQISALCRPLETGGWWRRAP
jgi:hypothetical protein